jgi:hypothetical protein
MNAIALQSFDDCSEYIRYIEYPTDKKYIINIETPKQWIEIYNKYFRSKKLPKSIYIVFCSIPWITKILQTKYKYNRHHVWNEEIYVDPRIEGVWVFEKYIRYYYNFSELSITFLSNSYINGINRYGYVCYRFLHENFDKIIDVILDIGNVKHHSNEFIQNLYIFGVLDKNTKELQYGNTGKMLSKYITDD